MKRLLASSCSGVQSDSFAIATATDVGSYGRLVSLRANELCNCNFVQTDARNLKRGISMISANYELVSKLEQGEGEINR
jgi:hypothetical protein